MSPPTTLSTELGNSLLQSKRRTFSHWYSFAWTYEVCLKGLYVSSRLQGPVESLKPSGYSSVHPANTQSEAERSSAQKVPSQAQHPLTGTPHLPCTPHTAWWCYWFSRFITVVMSGDKQATLLCAMQIRQMATEGFHCSTKTVRTHKNHHRTREKGRRYSENFKFFWFKSKTLAFEASPNLKG